MRRLVNATPFNYPDSSVFGLFGFEVEADCRVKSPVGAQPKALDEESLRVAASVPGGTDVLVGGSPYLVEALSAELLAKGCRLFVAPIAQARTEGNKGGPPRISYVAETPISRAFHAGTLSRRDPVPDVPAQAGVSGESVPSATASIQGDLSAGNGGAVASQLAPAPVVALGARPVPPASQPKRTVENVLSDLERFGSWGREYDSKVKELWEELAGMAPERIPEAKARIERSKAANKEADELRKLARRLGEAHPEVAAALKWVVSKYPFIGGKARKQVKKGEADRQVLAATRAKKVIGDALSKIVGGKYDHRIPTLSPSSRWTLLIDETGDQFLKTGAEEAKQGRQGKFAGVLVPAEVSLLTLPPDFHSVDVKDPEELDRRLQHLLDSRVGILGIALDGLPMIPGELWTAGVLEVVSWCFRLLPVSGPTQLDVFVEARGSFEEPDDWKPAAAALQVRYSETDRDRAAQVALTIRTVRKGQGTCTELGYADLVAFTWGSGRDDSRERLRKSGMGPCLLGLEVERLREAWDRFGRTGEVSGEQWRALVACGDAKWEDVYQAAILGKLRETCLTSPALWRRFFEAASQHLQGKAIDLRRLRSELSWLDACRPPATEFPALARLKYLTAQLATANHHGDVEVSLSERIGALAPELFEEAAPEVCYSALHVAVAATNRFDFSAARATLERWRDVPAAVPGLAMWSRIRSSLGQIEAFEGRPGAALSLFEEALACFRRLTDAHVSEAECRQTGAYRAIAAIDDETVESERVREFVEAVTGPFPDSILRLGRTTVSADKYAHHTLLRYLVTRGTEEERTAYLSTASEWGAGEGHPWPLILAYRAILLEETDPARARDLMIDAWDLATAEGQGPTVRLIGSVCGVIAASWGWEWEGMKSELKLLEQKLPLTSERISRLRNAADGPVQPLLLMAEVLPFNFR